MDFATMWKIRPKFLKAMEEQNVKQVNDILDSGFDIDHNLILCKNAISLCVANGWREIARVLVSRGCSLSLRNELGQLPLTIAVLQSDVELVELLLNHRANPKCVDLHGMTPLHYACNINNFRIVDLLTSHASRKFLLSQRDPGGDTPLGMACRLARDPKLIQMLLTRGSDPNVENKAGATPLFLALLNSKCNTDLLQMLVDAGADVNHQNYKMEVPLFFAFKVLLDYQHPNSSWYQPILRFLIERTRDISIPNDCGSTPLHFAVMLNDPVVVRWLLNKGADMYARDVLWHRPIDLARMPHRKASMVKDLMEQLAKQELQNQCRRVIRNTLLPKIEEKVQKLPLPQPLKDFIMLL